MELVYSIIDFRFERIGYRSTGCYCRIVEGTNFIEAAWGISCAVRVACCAACVVDLSEANFNF